MHESSRNPIEIFNQIARNEYVRIHGPEHHILDGATLLTAYYNASGNNNSITVNNELHAILTGLRNSLTDAKISEIDDFEKLLAWLNNN